MYSYRQFFIPAATVLLAVAVLPAMADAQKTCVAIGECPGGTVMYLCNEVCGGSCLNQWYDVGGKEFACSGYDCQAAAETAVNYCYSGSGGEEDPCDIECGGGCCDKTQACCNDRCIPGTAKCCPDGSYCADATAECCDGKCIPAGTVCCAGGSCPEGQECVESQCIPANGVKCDDGSYCPENTACADGKCCTEGYASYDPQSGFCCGAGPQAGLCECSVGCNGFCCPAGSTCCDGGFCASNTCPSCSQAGHRLCPDRISCAPAGATCCGNNSYCENGLTCMDCPTGKCCGNQQTPAQQASLLNGTIGDNELYDATASSPVGDSTPTVTPTAAETDAIAGDEPASKGGCQAGVSGSGAPATLLVMLAAAMILFIGRRRTAPFHRG